MSIETGKEATCKKSLSVASEKTLQGNAAKKHEALKGAQKCLETMVGCDMHRYFSEAQTCDGQTTTGDCGKMELCKVIFQIRAALAAPPRNCERFANETAAQIAFLKEVCFINVTGIDYDTFDCWTNLMKHRYVKWLLAEAEGGTT